MAWNTPGSNKRGTNKGSNGDGFERLLAPLRGLFDGNGGGGNPLRWIGILVVLWLAFSSFQLIGEQQRGVVLRFGQFSRVMLPGPHFKWPWPIERVIKVNATQIKTFSDNVPVLTSDENIVQVELNVQYRISDPKQFLFGTRDAELVLQQAALSTVREQVGRSDLATVLGARSVLAANARKQLQASLNDYRTGLVVTEFNLPNARPPDEVKPAFDDVNSAQQDKDRLTSEAEAYAAKVVPEARGAAARVRTAAEGYKTAKIAKATGDAERFSLLLAEYQDAPEVTRKRLWLETVEEVLADNRKVVGGDSRQLIYVPMSGQGAPGQGGQAAPTQPPLLPADVVMPPESEPSSLPRPPREPRTSGGQEASR